MFCNTTLYTDFFTLQFSIVCLAHVLTINVAVSFLLLVSLLIISFLLVCIRVAVLWVSFYMFGPTPSMRFSSGSPYKSSLQTQSMIFIAATQTEIPYMRYEYDLIICNEGPLLVLHHSEHS